MRIGDCGFSDWQLPIETGDFGLRMTIVDWAPGAQSAAVNRIRHSAIAFDTQQSHSTLSNRIRHSAIAFDTQQSHSILSNRIRYSAIAFDTQQSQSTFDNLKIGNHQSEIGNRRDCHPSLVSSFLASTLTHRSSQKIGRSHQSKTQDSPSRNLN
jgi:hypothetical protein